MKKKLLLFMALLCACISGAWAQTQVTALNTSKYYTLACSSTGHDATKVCLADVNGTIVGRSTSNTFFQFEAGESDGQYYIKSVASNKYIVASGTADGSTVSLSDTKDTYWTVAVTGTALYIRPNESTNTYLNNNMGDSPNLKIASGAGDCSKWKVCEYSAPINVSSTKGYKLKLKNTDYYLKFNTSYSETNAVNATTASTSGSVFRIHFATSGSTLKWRNEYMKTAGSYGWNSGHGTDASNSTWSIVPVDGEENTYYLKKSDNDYFGQVNSVNEGTYLYTNQGASSSNIKWQLEEVSMTECMQENGYWPQTSTSDAPKYYTIKSTHCNKYAKYNGDSEYMALIANRLESTANAFWFEQVSVDNDVLGVKIHNVEAEKCVSAVNSFTDEGITWYLKADVSSTKPSIAINSNATTWNNNDYGWNNYQGTGSSIHTWASTDGGSSWWVDRISDDEFTAMQAIYTHQITQLKEQAIAQVKSSSVLFGDWNESTSAAGIALAAINGVSMDNTEEALNSATTTINNALKTMYAAANDKKILFHTANRNSTDKYMVVVDAIQLAGANSADGRSEFTVNYVADTDGQFTLKNTATGRYIANTPSTSGRIQLATEAGKFTIKSWGTDNKFAFICVNPANAQHNSLHLNDGFNVVAWEADNENSASVWTIEASELSDDVLTAGENAVKQQAYVRATNAKPNASLFGEGLGKYTKNDTYNTTEAAIDAKSNDLDFEAILTLETTIKNQLSACLNMPQGGTFLRLKGGVSEKYVNANSLADQTNRSERVGMSASDDAGSIWYLDADKHLISYSKGYYITNTCDHSGEVSNASVYIFEASNSTPGRYYIHTSGAVFYDNGQPADRQCLDRQGLGRIAQTEKWILEEVPYMYAVTINDADAYVQTADEVQVKNGGYLYVADGTAEVTYTPAAGGYVANYEQDDEAKTITVTYTEEEEPVELVSGYYYIKNKASNKYLVNNYDFSTTTTLSDSKKTTNNGVWKVDVNDNKTITLKNGISTPLYVGGTSITKLTFVEDTPLTSGVYFTEKIDGSGDALAIGSEEASATTWVFEPITSTDKIIDVIVNGDNGEGVVSYNAQKATNGGFFRFDGGAIVNAENYTLSEIDDKESSKICRLNKEPYYVDAEYFVYNETAKEELQKLIEEIYTNVESNEIGYPKKNSIVYDSQATSEAWTNMFYCNRDENIIKDGDKSVFLSALTDARTIANFADINLPTPGSFYTLTNAEGTVTKTYFFKEGNGGLSQLLCYGGSENGQFAEISENFTSVAYKAIGNDSGEEFAFMAARTNEKGMPINLGKVCVWQSGEGPLPSGDDNFYSGWKIRRQEELPINIPASGYSTFYAPVDTKVPDNLTAYTANVDDDMRHVQFIELENDDNIIPAGTGVLIAGTPSTEATNTLIPLGVTEADPVDSDLKGHEYTLPYTLGNNTGYNALVNNVLVDWHAYTLQSGTWKRYTSTKLSGFKAHLELKDLDEEAGVKAYTFSLGDGSDATGIAEAIGLTNTNKEVYDLSGRRVSNPQKGLYIINGKKVMVK